MSRLGDNLVKRTKLFCVNILEHMVRMLLLIFVVTVEVQPFRLLSFQNTFHLLHGILSTQFHTSEGLHTSAKRNVDFFLCFLFSFVFVFCFVFCIYKEKTCI